MDNQLDFFMDDADKETGPDVGQSIDTSKAALNEKIMEDNTTKMDDCISDNYNDGLPALKDEE